MDRFNILYDVLINILSMLETGNIAITVRDLIDRIYRDGEENYYELLTKLCEEKFNNV